MTSALTRKSVTDLTRRKARAAFTMLTLALAVASVGIFAIPSLMSKAMNHEIVHSRIADVTLSMKPLILTDAQVARLRRLPNVAALEPRSVFSTRIYVGARRQNALVVGVPSFARQSVNVITVRSGSAPLGEGVLTDIQNARRDKLGTRAGGSVRVIARDGYTAALPITGEARSLAGGAVVANAGFAVLYARPRTVDALSGTPGYTELGLRLVRNDRASARRTIAAVDGWLRANTSFKGYSDLPEIREPNDWPGKENFEQLVSLMTVITALALLSALVLLSNTMTTLIGEQTGEIAAMKAIGATRRQIARIYRRTAVLLGTGGAIIGAGLGILLANWFVGFFGSAFYGIDTPLRVDPGILLVSLAAGVLGPPLAAMPATRRASRLPLADALHASGSVVGGQGRLDALLRRVRLVPRSAQIGLRGAARRKRRTLATAVQVALAVGTLLGMLALGTGVNRWTHEYFGQLRWDIWTQTYATQPFKPGAQRLIESTPGVLRAEPVLQNQAKLKGEQAFTWGLVNRPMFHLKIVDGRWFTPAEARARARVMVVNASLAELTKTRVGDLVNVDTAAGPVRFRVIGLNRSEDQGGTVLYTPLPTLQAVLRTPGEVNNYWVRTARPGDHAMIDRLTTKLEDKLALGGTQITTAIRYVQERDQVAAMDSLTRSIQMLGLLIVGISMVGLVNAITMGVIERTREIGMLRCVGARGRDVRRIFGVEGMTVAAVGWLLGVPIGWVIGQALVRLTRSLMHVPDLPFVFPGSNIVLTLVGTIVLAVLVLITPVRRAVRLKPGDALRYA